MENGGRSMEIAEIEAELVTSEEECFIQLNAEPPITIPVSDDNPSAVKSAFCALLRLLITGRQRISLKEAGEDLFSVVATTYIEQLNGELEAIYEEMDSLGFIERHSEGS